ncbi:hypothetical protein CERZMDRAFT_93300 [Cercospora zeae-maydis SCOH1-5]|uniref:Uncharacterized protein n=1 Tax=Cercospora zeae-maydis SCOH1-5 TaxID=717836 RepID=A0A6A6FVG9_9PEZI|nr:hypothetical protein CERZMDRAFT_93300 [Cercospora zeae-maydis SCOH1-5]
MNGLSCAGPLLGGTGVNYNEARSLISNFCSSAANSVFGPSTNQTGIYKTSQGNSDLQLTISYSTTQQTYDTACVLDPDTRLTVSQSSCEQAFHRLLDQCDTTPPASSLGKYGGIATSGCGVYTMTTAVEEIIACGGDPYPRATSMPEDIITEAIGKYCNSNLQLSPDYVPSSENVFLVDVPDGKSYYNFVKHGVVAKIVTQFNQQGQSGCASPKAFGTSGEECKRKLSAVREKCGMQGGGLSDNGVNGCVLWTVWGQAATG